MEKQINYKGIFAAGCAFLGAGVVFITSVPGVGISILGAGLGLMAVGLANRDKWEHRN